MILSKDQFINFFLLIISVINPIEKKTLTILAHVILAVVNVFRTIGTAIAWCTFARVMCKVVNAFSAILAWIEFRTEWNFRFAILSRETGWALACIRFNTIDACAVVLALILTAIVNVHFTTRTSVAGHAITTETSFFEYGARSISAWISITSINHKLTVFTMIAWFTNAFVLAFGSCLTYGLVLAWECETCVTFW